MTSTTPNATTTRAGRRIAEGDTYLAENILPPQLAKIAFGRVKAEVAWNTMHHRGGEVPRLVAVEGEIQPDGSIPIYRHPADASPALSPFSPTVALIRAHVERTLGHPVNHALIQLYRSGADYISEHSDKTIDVVHGAQIANVSLGAQRTMTLRTKKDAIAVGGERRAALKVPLPHNSMFAMGLATNRRWMHAVRADKRLIRNKSTAERAMGGERISLTFRWIGTYLTPGEERIFGQGAKGKTREEAGRVVNGGKEASALLRAFGEENHNSEFVWEQGYGRGFDVLHFRLPEEHTR
ncbi:hypothetical protein OF83DRAFT_631299 [Amylostereum chailletii]|nr:hypothetical protein OF83DRAFT_631299 [Amylostereum chailletii]